MDLGAAVSRHARRRERELPGEHVVEPPVQQEVERVTILPPLEGEGGCSSTNQSFTLIAFVALLPKGLVGIAARLSPLRKVPA